MHLKITLLSVGDNKIPDKYLNLLLFLPKLYFAIKKALTIWHNKYFVVYIVNMKCALI